MNQKVAVAVVYVSAIFMSIMDTTIVNVALPTLGRNFHVVATSVSSVSIAFLVSLAVFIPASGWIGDRFGGKRVLLVAVGIFTVASALCGMAQNMTELVIFRVLQGAGGGLMTPVGMAMLFRVFPPAERVRASSILTVAVAFAPAIGPVLGGLLVSDLSWRWVFFVNLPIGAVVIGFGLLFLRPVALQRPGAFDVRGFVLSGVGLGLLMYGVSEGPSKSWRSPDVIATILLGLVLLAMLIRLERRIDHPLINFGLLTNRLFRLGVGVTFLTTGTLLGTLYVVSLFYQDGRGLSALAAGLSTFPEAVGVMIGSQFASRLFYSRLGPRRHITLGSLMMAVSVTMLVLIGSTTNLWWSRVCLFAIGFSLAQVVISTQAASFATISLESTGDASTMFNAMRQLGGAVGVAAFTSVVVAVGAVHLVSGHLAANLAAYHGAFVAAAGFAILAAVIGVRINDADAASTIVRRRKAKPKSPLVQQVGVRT